MGIKVDFHSDALVRKLSHDSLVRGQKAAANEAHQAMEKYVPMLHTDSSTNLRSMSFVNNNGTKINYSAVYAKAQFYGFVGGYPGYRVHNYTTPGTSRRWDLRLKGNKHDISLVKEAFVKGAQWNGS